MKEQDEELQNNVSQGFNKHKKNIDSDIHRNDNTSALFGAVSRNDFAYLDNVIKTYQHSHLRKNTKIE